MAVQKLGQSTLETTQEKFQPHFTSSKKKEKEKKGYGKWEPSYEWMYGDISEENVCSYTQNRPGIYEYLDRSRGVNLWGVEKFLI